MKRYLSQAVSADKHMIMYCLCCPELLGPGCRQHTNQMDQDRVLVHLQEFIAVLGLYRLKGNKLLWQFQTVSSEKCNFALKH